MKKGRLNKKEIAFIEQTMNIPVEKVAEELDRSVDSVLKRRGMIMNPPEDKVEMPEVPPEDLEPVEQDEYIEPASLKRMRIIDGEETSQKLITKPGAMPTRPSEAAMRQRQSVTGIKREGRGGRRVPVKAGAIQFKYDPSAERYEEDDPTNKYRAERRTRPTYELIDVQCHVCNRQMKVPSTELGSIGPEGGRLHRCERCSQQ